MAFPVVLTSRDELELKDDGVELTSASRAELKIRCSGKNLFVFIVLILIVFSLKDVRNDPLSPEQALEALHSGLNRVLEGLRAADPELQEENRRFEARLSVFEAPLKAAGLPQDLIEYLCDSDELGLTDLDSLQVIESSDLIGFGCSKASKLFLLNQQFLTWPCKD